MRGKQPTALHIQALSGDLSGLEKKRRCHSRSTRSGSQVVERMGKGQEQGMGEEMIKIHYRHGQNCQRRH